MDISYEALVVIAQVVPILLLASYFDSEVLSKISTYSRRTKYSWLTAIYVIVIGEFTALMGIIGGKGADGIGGFVVAISLVVALVNLLNVASWRILGRDLVSGNAPKPKKSKK